MLDMALLWGLMRYRRETAEDGNSTFSFFPLISWDSRTREDSMRCNLLWGLLGYEREGLQRTYRLLYFLKFGGGRGSDHDNP